MRRSVPWALIVVILLLVAAPFWLPLFGTALTVGDNTLEPADAALVLEGTGVNAVSAAESWRQDGIVQDVVIVEAPVRTHALVAYWSDFVRWGLAAPSPTPAEHLRVVRAASTEASEQAKAALPAVQAFGAHSVVIVGGGGIGSRLVERQLVEVLQPAGIGVRMVPYGGGESLRDAARWYENAEDRRAVLDGWLRLLVPYLGGYEAGT